MLILCLINGRRGIMTKRVLIITSVTTGSGHKSIADSIEEQFLKMPDVVVKVIDGFDMSGRLAYHSSATYGSVTRHAPWFYNILWKITDAHQPRFTITGHTCRIRFLECVNSFKPDLIITVHSFFNTLVTDILKSAGLNIPVVVVQADLVSIHSTWCNPDAYRTICPTAEAYECNLKHNMPADKLKILGFPVRSRFVKAARESVREDYKPGNPLRVLITGGGEGSSGIRDYAEKILQSPDTVITIICGRNEKMCERLKRSLGERYKDRVRILGFIDNMEYEMLRNDLLIARGSPNTLTEAVIMGIPVIMTGPFLEQERGNYTLAQTHNLGLVSASKDDVLPLLQGLLANGAEGLKKIRAAQEEYRCFDNAYNIADYSLSLID